MCKAIRLPVLLFLAVLFCGCTAQVRPDPITAFPHRVNRFDVQFAWQATPAADSLQIRGVLKNVRYAYMENLELHLTLLDRDKRVLARDTFFVIPHQIPMDDSAPFAVTLKSPPTPGAVLQFLYRYDVNDSDDHFRWMSSFKTDAASGAVLGE